MFPVTGQILYLLDKYHVGGPKAKPYEKISYKWPTKLNIRSPVKVTKMASFPRFYYTFRAIRTT